MNNVVNFLEKNVQWIALGLGGLFLLLMVYVYVLGTPVPVPPLAGAENLTPGTVDDYTRDKLAAPLKLQMEDGSLMNLGGGADPIAVVQDSFDRKPGPELAAIAWNAPSVPVGKLKEGPDGGGEGLPPKEKLVALPVAPAPVYSVAPRTGTAYVQAVAPNPQANGANGPGGFPPPAPAPLPGVSGAAPVATEVAGAKDLAWVMVRYEVPMAKLAQTFRKAGIPVPQSQTYFLDAQLIRQEKQGEGWGKPTTVARLDLDPVPALPASLKSNRVENAQRQAAADYLTATKDAQQPILQPAFYPVLQGDNPMVEPAPVVPGAGPLAFEPGTYDGPLDNLTPDQRKLVMDARRQQAADKAAEQRNQPNTNTPRNQPNTNTPRNPPTPGRDSRNGAGGRSAQPGRGARPAYAPRDPEREAQESQQDRQLTGPREPFFQLDSRTTGRQPDPRSDRYGTRYDPRPGDRYGNRGGYPNPAGGAGQALQVPPPPQAPFDPSQQLDVSGWLFDTTAEPNATYRYKVVYRVKNPLYDTRNIAANPDVEKALWIESPRDDNSEASWGQPVTVQPLTYLYLAGTVRPNASGVKFSVYRRYQGQEKAKEFSVDIGDPIGVDESGAGPDYRTGYTLVDLRSGPDRDSYALLMDANGRVIARRYETDRNDPKKQQLQQEVDQNNAAASPAAGGAGPTARSNDSVFSGR